jgi:hypothetical protein
MADHERALELRGFLHAHIPISDRLLVPLILPL